MGSEGPGKDRSVPESAGWRCDSRILELFAPSRSQFLDFTRVHLMGFFKHACYPNVG